MQKSFSVLILIFTTARVNGYLRSDCVCGVVNTESRRITNGVVVMPFKYPWMVAIFNAHKKAYCGGSLISDRHVTTSACSKRERITFWTYFQVLTAAHCVSWQKYDVLPFRQKKQPNLLSVRSLLIIGVSYLVKSNQITSIMGRKWTSTLSTFILCSNRMAASTITTWQSCVSEFRSRFYPNKCGLFVFPTWVSDLID